MIMAKKERAVCTKFDKDTVTRIDTLVLNHKFDSRSSFIRRSVIEYLAECEEKILA
jgi:metal-responsive CopG/Arc/MetJ family transcriptional regulator